MLTVLDFSARLCARVQQKVKYKSTGAQLSFQQWVSIARDCSNESQSLLFKRGYIAASTHARANTKQFIRTLKHCSDRLIKFKLFRAEVKDDTKRVTLLTKTSPFTTVQITGTQFTTCVTAWAPQCCAYCWYQIGCQRLLAQSASANPMNELYTERALRAMLAQPNRSDRLNLNRAATKLCRYKIQCCRSCRL